ncbi:MAG: glycosyl hydrolase family 18 protein [Bacteroidetes bacterium]|nr:glycosyl hydrolase family 18 protein [Bacteroidota bacterium]
MNYSTDRFDIVNKTQYLIISLILGYCSCAVAQDFKVVGYMPSWNFGLIEQIQLDKVTHVNLAFANPDDEGGIVTGDGDEPVRDIKPIVEIIHDAGVSVFISIGGAVADHDKWESLINPIARSQFIHKIIAYVLENDLQGIDIDLEWENVTDNYTGFVLELRDLLDKYDLYMTAALPGIYRYSQVTDEVIEAYDWINMMAYDLRGPWKPSDPGPHSPYEFAQDAINYWTGQGVEPERLTLGVPFYGYDFSNLNNIIGKRYVEIVAENPDYSKLDQVGELYYNGLYTIGSKTALALREVGGIMIWELSQDTFDEYSLLNKIHEVIQMPVGIERQIENVILEIYPVPFDDQININFDKIPTVNVDLTLIDVNGRAMISSDWNGNDQQSLDTSHLPGGVYFLVITSQGFVQSRKLGKR